MILFGDVLDTGQDLSEERVSDLRNDHEDCFCLLGAELLGQPVGVIIQLLDRLLNSGSGLWQNIGGPLDHPGDRGYGNTGFFCHVVDVSHECHPVFRFLLLIYMVTFSYLKVKKKNDYDNVFVSIAISGCCGDISRISSEKM